MMESYTYKIPKSKYWIMSTLNLLVWQYSLNSKLSVCLILFLRYTLHR